MIEENLNRFALSSRLFATELQSHLLAEWLTYSGILCLNIALELLIP